MKKKLKRGNDDNSPNTKCSDNTNETEDKVDEELTKQKVRFYKIMLHSSFFRQKNYRMLPMGKSPNAKSSNSP